MSEAGENGRRVLAWIDEAFAGLEEANRIRRARRIEWIAGMRARVDGREAVVFCSNDYLGLSREPGLGEPPAGTPRGSSGSRLITGSSAAHEALEWEVAEWKGDEEALLFGNGYLANLGVIPALVGKGDAVFSDELNHASIIDGCRLSRAEVVVFPHRDAAALGAALQRSTKKRRLVVTESLFSMDGDVAPIADYAAFAERYGAMLVVDEAHASGVFGPEGAGVVRALGFNRRVTATVTTLGKAIGCEGAVVSGSRAVVRWLANRARTFVFSTAPSPLVIEAAVRAVRFARRADDRRAKLRDLSERFRARVGGASGSDGISGPIVPVRVGESLRVLSWGDALMDRGFFVQPIRPPTVPEGAARLRVTFSALHDIADVDALASAVCEIRERL